MENNSNRLTESQIRQQLIDHASAYAPDSSLIAVVQSVDASDCTCVLVDEDDQELFNVRLKAIIGTNKSVVQFPRVGAYVLAVRIEGGDDWMVVSCSDLEQLEIQTANASIVITDDAITLNGGQNQGLINIVQLTAKINELITAFNAHTHPVAGAATAMPVTPIQPFVKDDYEDKKITH